MARCSQAADRLQLADRPMSCSKPGWGDGCRLRGVGSRQELVVHPSLSKRPVLTDDADQLSDLTVCLLSVHSHQRWTAARAYRWCGCNSDSDCNPGIWNHSAPIAQPSVQTCILGTCGFRALLWFRTAGPSLRFPASHGCSGMDHGYYKEGMILG